MIQPLQTENDHLKGKISTLKKDTANLSNKPSQWLRVLRYCLKEFILLNVLIRLCQRVVINWLIEGNMNAIKIISKDKTLSLLDRLHTLEYSVRALDQEIQTLPKAVVKRFEKIEELIRFDNQGQKVQRQNEASSLY